MEGNIIIIRKGETVAEQSEWAFRLFLDVKPV